jgi:flagellar hook-associated protein 1 FlgK
MGLSGALLNAVSGLSVTQSGLEIVARNVANADTDGYSRKTLSRINETAGGQGLGVRAGAVARAFDALLASQLRTELGEEARLGVLASSLGRLDAMLGSPGSASALDTALNDFIGAFSALADQPESAALRANLLTQAETVAGRLNTLSRGVQSLRQEAENGIASAVADANWLLERLVGVNADLARAYNAVGTGSADLLDERDRLLADLSKLMGVKFQEQENGGVRVFTSSGHLLLDGAKAAELHFEGSAGVNATALYDRDPAKSGLGTVLLDNGSGQLIDLFKDGGLAGGAIGGFRELRDERLVAVQAQLDELAHALASVLSENVVAGTAATQGAQAGFDLDLAAMQPGDEITLTYVETPGGVTRTVTLIRVADASLLPLGEATTPATGDTVIGFDLSGGIAAAAAALDAALGSGIAVSNPSGSILRILDDGASGTTDVAGLAGSFTATGLVDQGLGLALFSDGPGGATYSNALEGGGQKLGFAARISLNPAVKADDASLVVYSTSPATALGDQARPAELLARLSATAFDFSPASGLGSPGAPIKETIAAFARRVVDAQTREAALVGSRHAAQSAATRTLSERHHAATGVDIDAELAQLIALQMSYAANARVITVVQDLLNILMRA